MAPDRRTLVAALLRKARIDAGKSLDDAGAQVGVTPRTLQNYEAARKNVSLPILEMLAAVYRVPVSYFWQDELPKQDSCPSPDSAKLTAARLLLRQKLLGAQLRQARVSANKSLQDAGEAVGANARRVQQYEEARREVPLCELEQLAELYGTPIQTFVTEERGEAIRAAQAGPRPSSIDHLSLDLRDFVTNPVNTLYLHAALRMSRLKVDDLRKLGESLLEITY